MLGFGIGPRGHVSLELTECGNTLLLKAIHLGAEVAIGLSMAGLMSARVAQHVLGKEILCVSVWTCPHTKHDERGALADLGRNTVGPHVEAMFPDIEVLESWFPLLFMERSSRGTGLGGGAGAYRAGGGNRFSFRLHGIGEIRSMLAGMRRWLPLQGFAGGRPGDGNRFLIHRGDGSVEQLDVSSSGARVGPEDWFEMRLGSGGG